MSDALRKLLGIVVIVIALVVVVVGINAFSGSKSDQAPSVGTLSLIVIAGVGILLGMLAIVAIAYSLAGLANAGEAFGLPSGSVRALLALLITIGFIVVAFPQVLETKQPPKTNTFLSFFDTSAYAQAVTTTTDTTGTMAGGGKKPTDSNGAGTSSPNSTNDLPKQVLQILGTLMTTIVGFYFGSKSATDASAKVGEAIKSAMGKQ